MENTSIKIKTKISIEDLAADFSSSSDNEQAAFLNIFFKALRVNCESQYHYEMQLTSIRRKMTDQAQVACEYLSPFDDK
jgi:hypothetical protein